MPVRFLPFCAAALLVVLPRGSLACGDKFLVGAHALLSQQIVAASSPGNILVYWNPPADSSPEERKWNSKFERIVHAAGHRVQVTTDLASFRASMRDEEFDLLMLSLEDARELPDVGARDGRTAVLPYAYFVTRETYAAAKKEFGAILKAPLTARQLISTLDNALR